MIIIASVPLVAAALIDGYIEALSSSTGDRHPAYLKRRLAAAVRLPVGKTAAQKRRGKRLGSARPLDALLIGLCQFGGNSSRHLSPGSTITGGIAVGPKRETAVKFSFCRRCRRYRREYTQTAGHD